MNTFYPPPPYSTNDFILGSPVAITTQLLGSPVNSPAAEDWMVEKSREELSELLFKADGIIKSRESGIAGSYHVY